MNFRWRAWTRFVPLWWKFFCRPSHVHVTPLNRFHSLHCCFHLSIRPLPCFFSQVLACAFPVSKADQYQILFTCGNPSTSNSQPNFYSSLFLSFVCDSLLPTPSIYDSCVCLWWVRTRIGVILSIISNFPYSIFFCYTILFVFWFLFPSTVPPISRHGVRINSSPRASSSARVWFGASLTYASARGFVLASLFISDPICVPYAPFSLDHLFSLFSNHRSTSS